MFTYSLPSYISNNTFHEKSACFACISATIFSARGSACLLVHKIEWCYSELGCGSILHFVTPGPQCPPNSPPGLHLHQTKIIYPGFSKSRHLPARVHSKHFTGTFHLTRHRLTLPKGIYSFRYFLLPVRIPNLLMHVFMYSNDLA